MPQFDRLGNDMSDDIADALAWEEEKDDMSYDNLDVAGHSRYDYIDPYQEAMEDELGAAMGDPRRCPHHPHVITSSPDGMFDAPCDVCEGEMEEDARRTEYEEWLKTAPKCSPLPYNVVCQEPLRNCYTPNAYTISLLAQCAPHQDSKCEEDYIPF